MLRWWRRRHVERERIERDAIELMERHGDQAYYIAREHMANAVKLGDTAENVRWTMIREHIRKLSGHPGYQGDTATRYKHENLR